MLAMPALHPAPSVVAISALAPSQAQQLADAWGTRHAVQAWEGFGPGKALFWKPALRVVAIGREQLYERTGKELAAARGALSLTLGWHDATFTVYCARIGSDAFAGEMTAGEIARMLAHYPTPAVVALTGDGFDPQQLAPLRDAKSSAAFTRILTADADAPDDAGACIFGVAHCNGSSVAKLAQVFTDRSRLYCTPGFRVAQAVHVVARRAVAPDARGNDGLQIASCYDVVLASADSISSRTEGSGSEISSAASAPAASVPPSSPSAHAA